MWKTFKCYLNSYEFGLSCTHSDKKFIVNIKEGVVKTVVDLYLVSGSRNFNLKQ